MSCCDHAPGACCCPQAPLPGAPENPPGLTALNYRIGDHGRFFEAMKERIARWEIPGGARRPLADLKTRRLDDPAIAWMDAWAVSSDVLSFYQERIANEGFLRTATERLSVRELARQIGYALKPGVAAAVYLAWTVEEAPGAPVEAFVPAGTQTQSLPKAAGDLPQTFETAADFTARRTWNAMALRASTRTILSGDCRRLDLAGTGLLIQRGDVLVLGAGGDLRAWKVEEAREKPGAGVTRVILDSDGSEPEQEPEWPSLPAATPVRPGDAVLPLTRENVQGFLFGRAWNEGDLRQFLDYHDWDADAALAMIDALSDGVNAGSGEVFRLREGLNVYGSNAPRYGSLPAATTGTTGYPYNWDSSWTIWKDSVTGAEYANADFYLEREMKDLLPGQRIAIFRQDGVRLVWSLGHAAVESLNGFATPAKVTGLRVQGLGGGDKSAAFAHKTTRVFVGEEALGLAELKLPPNLAAGGAVLVLASMVLDLSVGQMVCITGALAEAPDREAAEMATLKAIEHAGGYTRLTLASGLENAYVRESVRLNANLTRATHGESVKGEILGTSDGASAFQRYYLKKTPLTYIPGGGASGASAELEVRVNGVLWHETGSLHFSGSRDRHYQVKYTEDGAVMVQFGDGVQGVVPPAALDGLKASYRAGLGLRGQVGAGAITLMKQKPYGAKAVKNPREAFGGEDPEAMEDARENAPRTVRTLDRVVSLRDYEDFARGYAGIGKASASLLWVGRRQLAHLSLLGPRGEALADEQMALFAKALEALRDPGLPYRLQNGSHKEFRLNLGVVIHPDHRFEDVEKVLRAALLKRFGYEALSFGDAVYASQIVETAMGIAGVTAVDVEDLSVVGESPTHLGIRAWIPARLAKAPQGGAIPEPASTLSLNEVGLVLDPRTSL